MVQGFKLIVGFYKQFAVISLLINLLLVVLKIDGFPALIIKFLLIGTLGLGIAVTDRKNQLDFYRNLKLAPAVLFLGVLIFDFLLFAILYTFGGWFLK